MHSASVREAFLLKPRFKKKKEREKEKTRGGKKKNRKGEREERGQRGGKITQEALKVSLGKVGGSATLPLNDFRRTYSFEFHFGTLNLIKK